MKLSRCLEFCDIVRAGCWIELRIFLWETKCLFRIKLPAIVWALSEWVYWRALSPRVWRRRWMEFRLRRVEAKLKNKMRTIILLLLSTAACYAQPRTPINRSYLQTSIDGNGKSITNLASIQVSGNASFQSDVTVSGTLEISGMTGSGEWSTSEAIIAGAGFFGGAQFLTNANASTFFGSGTIPDARIGDNVVRTNTSHTLLLLRTNASLPTAGQILDLNGSLTITNGVLVYSFVTNNVIVHRAIAGPGI